MMRFIYAFLALVLFSLASCCEGDELEKHLLTDNDKAFIPYQLNEKIPFVYSNGFEFDLAVALRDIEMKTTDRAHCDTNYNSFEELYVNLQSDTPELNIKMSQTPKSLFSSFQINVNKNSFSESLHEISIYQDTMTFNGKLYRDVYTIDRSATDTTVVVPQTIFYNTSDGILQIKLTNHETFTINK